MCEKPCQPRVLGSIDMDYRAPSLTRSPWAGTRPPSTSRRAVTTTGQLGRAGSNVNQAARALNSGVDAPHFAAALADLQHAAQAVQRAADRITNRQEEQAA